MVSRISWTWHWGSFGAGLLLSLVLVIAWGVMRAYQSYDLAKATISKLQEKLTPDGKLKALVFREEANGFDPRELVVVVQASHDFRPKGVMSKSLADSNEPDLCCFILGRADVEIKWKQNNRLLVLYSLDRERTTIIQRQQAPNVENVELEYGSLVRASRSYGCYD